MLKTLLVASALAAASIIPATAQQDVNSLIHEWQQANTMCRGTYPGDPRQASACDERSRLFAQLNKASWCFGLPGQFGYQMTWHKCDASGQMR